MIFYLLFSYVTGMHLCHYDNVGFCVFCGLVDNELASLLLFIYKCNCYRQSALKVFSRTSSSNVMHIFRNRSIPMGKLGKSYCQMKGCFSEFRRMHDGDNIKSKFQAFVILIWLGGVSDQISLLVNAVIHFPFRCSFRR